jgi:hypothetical protein
MPGRIGRLALVAWVAVLLVIPAAGFALGFRGENIDNRTLAKGPGWTLHTLTHSSAWHHAADAFSDHMPLRDRAIRWRAETEFNVFHDSPRPNDVIVGRDQWLFLHEEFTTCTLFPTVPTGLVAQAFALAHAVARGSGRELYTLLIPAKSTIESDHYRSSQYTFEACPRAREQELEALMRQQPGSIDLWGPMRAAKRAGGDLWLANDSHLDARGSILLTKALVQAIRPSSWQEGLEEAGPPSPSVGDLDVLAGITDTRPRHSLVLHGAPKQPITTPTLTIGDSQFVDSGPEITPYFSSRQDVSLDAMLSGGVTPDLIRAARLVIVESVQRQTFSRVSTYLYPEQLIDALLPDIHGLPASYGEDPPGSGVTLGAGITNTRVRTERDDAGTWRLLIFKVLAATAPINVSLLDAQERPRATPDSARGALAVGALVGMAVAPGVPLSEVQLSIETSGATRLSPLRVAALPRG